MKFPLVLSLVFSFPAASVTLAEGDILSFLEPEMTLRSMDQKTDQEALLKLIEGKGAEAAGGDYDTKAAERSIQNLASSQADIRESARGKLIAMGPALKSRLEEVAAKDPRRAEEAKQILAVFDAGMQAAGKLVPAQRLLAVRLAGDRKMATLVPAMEEAARKGDVFLERAAREALAKIASKDPPAPAAASSIPLAYLEALPANTNLLLEAKVDMGKLAREYRLDKALDKIRKATAPGGTAAGGTGTGIGAGAGAGAGAGRDETVAKMASFILTQVAEYGNARLDEVVLINVGAIADRGAGIAFLVHGECERGKIEKALEANTGFWTVQEMAKRKVFTSPFLRLVFLDDQTALLLPQQASLHFQLPAYLEALDQGTKPLRSKERWAVFLSSLEKDVPLRGLFLCNQDTLGIFYKELDREASRGFPTQDTVDAMKRATEVEGEVLGFESTTTSLRVEASFEKDGDAAKLVAFIKENLPLGIAELTEEIERARTRPSRYGPPVRFMEMIQEAAESVHVVAERQRGIGRAKLDLMAFGIAMLSEFER